LNAAVFLLLLFDPGIDIFLSQTCGHLTGLAEFLWSRSRCHRLFKWIFW